MKEPTELEMIELWEICQEFVAEHKLKDADDVGKSKPADAAPELVEQICEIVGYCGADEDEEHNDE